MNKSSTDTRRLICRLCSNNASLISLFKGKSRTVRDFIRKIVAVTIGIKYEEDSYYDCICFSCVVETFNILVFKTKSLKNEEKLQALVPKTAKQSYPRTKLSDIELPDCTELKPILTQWFFTKSFISTESGESTDKSSTEGSTSACVKSTADKSVQTNASKCFNVSIQTTFKPIIPKISIETQTNLFKTTNVTTQCNLSKSESRQKNRIKNKHTQCDLSALKIETKKSNGLFDVSTQTVDFKNENKDVITRKFDFDQYKCVHKTLNNRIKHTNSDKTKSKKLIDKLKHKSSRNIELFEPIKTDKAAVALKLTEKSSGNDSIESKNDDNSSKLTPTTVQPRFDEQLQHKNERVNNDSDKLATETLIITSKEDETKDSTVGNENVRLRRQRSSQIKITLLDITKSSSNTKDSPKSEIVSNASQLNQSDDRSTSGLLKIIERVASPKAKETDVPIEITSQPDPSAYNLLPVDGLLEVKVEEDPLNDLVDLGTSIVLKSSPLSYEDEPSPTDDSPNSEELLQMTGKVDYLRTCPECGRIIHTKNEMVEHRKSHMKCYLCKKRFTSIKKTKEHMNNDCIRKLYSTTPVISLMKMEDCENLTNQYPVVLDQIIKKSPRKKRKNDHPEEKSSGKKIVLQRSTSSSQ